MNVALVIFSPGSPSLTLPLLRGIRQPEPPPHMTASSTAPGGTRSSASGPQTSVHSTAPSPRGAWSRDYITGTAPVAAAAGHSPLPAPGQATFPRPARANMPSCRLRPGTAPRQSALSGRGQVTPLACHSPFFFRMKKVPRRFLSGVTSRGGGGGAPGKGLLATRR